MTKKNKTLCTCMSAKDPSEVVKPNFPKSHTEVLYFLQVFYNE